MKLLYITNARIPTEKAHGLQILKMCEAFQRQGIHVKLMVPFRMQSPEMKQVQNIWDHYDIETRFTIKRLLVPDFVKIGDKLPAFFMMLLYYIQCFIFSTVAIILTFFERNTCYYSRDLQTIFLLCLTKSLHRKKIYFEAHELHGTVHPASYLMRWMLCHIDGLIVITHRLKALYTSMGMPAQDVLVVPDGIDAKRLFLSLDKSESRQKLQISLDTKIICYTGHLFQWKGIYTLTGSVRYLPEDCLIYIVGGRKPDIISLQRFITEQHLSNIVMTGYVPYTDVPLFLGAADVLVLPNSAEVRISREYTSPLKLFEYMGARRPIVASDLPSLREILRHKENAYLVQPDNPKMLADGILHVIQDKTLSERMMETAYAEVQEYTWDRRATKVIEFFKISDDV
jgi:glycosyltransferase involved in cell wall biosynthesis